MDIRNIFFKFRSYTPIPIALTIIYFSDPYLPFSFIGFGLILMGEIIRISAVRFAGGATRTRKVGAPFLCTSGPLFQNKKSIILGKYNYISRSSTIRRRYNYVGAFFLCRNILYRSILFYYIS